MTTESDDIRTSRPVVRATIIGVVLWAVGFTWLFRAWIFQGGDGIWGDLGDARLLIAWLEHWSRWFSGAEPDWRSPIIFYPKTNTLGYSDAYFLYALPYSLLRKLGVDPFASFMGVMAALSVIGFSSFMKLAIHRFGVRASSAALGAFLFAFGNMMAVKAGHAQSYCAMLLPLIVDLMAGAFASGRRRAIMLASFAGLIHALIFFTAYLTGWFFAALALFVGVAYALLLGSSRAAFLRLIFVNRYEVSLAFVVGFFIGIIPFLALYVPVLLEGLSRGISAYEFYSPWITDIINVGGENLVWGKLLEALRIANQPGRPLVEVELGYSPLLFTTWIVFAIILYTRHRREPDEINRDRFFLACGLVLVGMWLIQLNWFGLMPWRAVYLLVPGASAVRTTFRSQIVNNLLASLLLVVATDQLRAWLYTHKVPTIVLSALGLALVFEQINLGAPKVFSRAQQLGFLAAIDPVPKACHAFYLSEGPLTEPWYVYQSDAALVAELFGIPTVNGNSSNWPQSWQLNDPNGPGYNEHLAEWKRKNGMSDAGLCGLDPRSGRWTVPDSSQ